jgi:hypothetical protein
MRTIGISVFGRSPCKKEEEISICQKGRPRALIFWVVRTYEGEGGIAKQLTGHRDSISNARGRVCTPGK